MNNYILAIIFIAATVYFTFLVFVYYGIQRVKEISKKQPKNDSDKFISVIIPFRNESENLSRLITSLESQNYRKDLFEIIFVNDHSTDDSENIIRNSALTIGYQILQNELQKNYAFKKQAITRGVNKAVGEYIVTTDADSILQRNWLKNISESFTGNIDYISGPVSFLTQRNSIIEQAQQIEFAGLILVGAGLIGIEYPLICSGANVAFRKSAFLKVRGYEGNLHLSSGDDEFLMQKISKIRKENIQFLWNTESVVLTNPNKNVGEFMQQRKRWASKGLFYNKPLVILLLFIFLFYLSLIYLGISSLLSLPITKIFLFLFSIKFLLEYYIVREGKDFLFNKKIIKKMILIEFLQIPYIVYSAIAGALGNYNWKDRKIKR